MPATLSLLSLVLFSLSWQVSTSNQIRFSFSVIERRKEDSVELNVGVIRLPKALMSVVYDQTSNNSRDVLLVDGGLFGNYGVVLGIGKNRY